MFIRKSKISDLIAKEKKRERIICEKEKTNILKKITREIEEKNRKTIEELKKNYDNIIIQKDNQIGLLRKEIDKHYFLYREIRKREEALDTVTSDVEDEVEKMLLKIHESIQPFYRTRAKIETIKRFSNRKNGKMENTFYIVK